MNFAVATSSGRESRTNTRRTQATKLGPNGSVKPARRPQLPPMSHEMELIFAKAKELSVLSGERALVEAFLLVLKHSSTATVMTQTPLNGLHQLVLSCKGYRQQKVSFFTALLECSAADLINLEAAARGELGQADVAYRRIEQAIRGIRM